MMDIKEALEYLHTIPAEKWNMATYHDCGSVGCALGHLAQHPEGKYGRLEKRTKYFYRPYSYWTILFKDTTYYASDYKLLGRDMFDLSITQSAWLFGSVEGAKDQKDVFFRRASRLEF